MNSSNKDNTLKEIFLDLAEKEKSNSKNILKAINNINEQNTDDKIFLNDFDKIEKKINKRHFNFNNIYKYASIALLIFSVGVSYLHFNDTKITYNSFNTAKNETANILLNDGTQVFLTENSVLEVPNNYSAKNRNVKLNGQAFFEVKHNKQSKFNVNSGKYKLIVHGTKFNLKAREQEDIIASLVEGSIEIDLSQFNLEHYFIKPNQSFTFVRNTNSFKIANYRKDIKIDWKKNTIYYDNTKFSNIIRDLNELYNSKIILNNKEIGDYEVNGEFKNMKPLEVLRRIKRIVPFEINNKASKIVLTEKKDK
jgi:ferric-dicitrate binding protein FerR (iron transport regulator)